MPKRNTVVGVFDEGDAVEHAINALEEAGFAAEEISVAARCQDAAGAIAKGAAPEASAGAATGALAGGMLGGVAGWLLAIGALAIPGIGPIIAAGPLAGALGGAAFGAVGGGMVGAFTGTGVPEHEAAWLDERERAGGLLVTVSAEGRCDEARAIMAEHGAHHVEPASGMPHGPGTRFRET